MSKIQGKLFVHSCCYLWPHGWEGRNKCAVQGGRYAARNSTRIVNGSIRKLSWRGLSCKKLKMGNICPRDKFFTQYLVWPLRDIPFNFRAILLTEIVNLNTFSWASCRLHSRKEQKKQNVCKKRKLLPGLRYFSWLLFSRPQVCLMYSVRILLEQTR